jgi:transposase InsO family protein
METVHTTIPALEMAFANRKALIFHSDRGMQYCAKAFRNQLQELCPPVRQSMSRKGNCWDNACAETFFKTLKRELETVDGKHTAGEVRQSVFMYIEAYYNRIRLPAILHLSATSTEDPPRKGLEGRVRPGGSARAATGGHAELRKARFPA